MAQCECRDLVAAGAGGIGRVLGRLRLCFVLQLEALQRIQVVRVFSIYELLSALQELRDRLSQQVGARLRAPLPSPELQGGQQGLCARQVTPDCLILGALDPLCSPQPLKLLDLLLHVAHGASLQVVSSMGPLKVVLLDSVSAVIYPLLGGRQSEGELCHCVCQEAAELSACLEEPLPPTCDVLGVGAGAGQMWM